MCGAFLVVGVPYVGAMTTFTTSRPETPETPDAHGAAGPVDPFDRAMAVLVQAGIGFEVVDEHPQLGRAA